ncbi:MAG: hypothetical protein II368_00235, partial [Clostridia bacterium]|nr:hypothetical protein [Clostridia bacterium]
CSSLTHVYYGGTESDWGNISIDSYNTSLTTAIRYYYSEERPTIVMVVEGMWWHYDEEGNPVIWK